MEDGGTGRPGYKAPEGYDASMYERPSVACDVAIFGFGEERLQVLLIERGGDPFKGYWALPGGFVGIDESIEAAAVREVEEETGLKGIHPIELGTFGDPKRDPRTRVISAAFIALVRLGRVNPRAGDDADKVRWFPVKKLPELAFDHGRIMEKARERLKHLALLTPRILELLPREFTRDQFRQLSREVMGRRYDADAFYQAMDKNPAFKPADGVPGRGRILQYDKSKYQMGDFMFLLLSD